MRMTAILLSALIGLGLIGWAVYLMAYRHPADYTEGRVVIRPQASSTAAAGADAAPAAPEPAAAPASEIILEGHVFHVDLADTMAKRAQGLSGRPPLAADQGMLFIFPYADRYSFWMKDMRFALDIVWIKGDTVVDVSRNVPPPGPDSGDFSLPTYLPASPADKVLEISAGLADRFGIGAGDKAILRIGDRG